MLRPIAAILCGATISFATPALAQVQETSGSGQADLPEEMATPALTLAEVESALASIEADSEIEDSVKALSHTK